MSDMALPTRPEQITAGWLTEAFDFRFPGTRVTDARIEDVIRGTSTKIRVRAQYDANGQRYGLPATFIVKGGFEDHSVRMKALYHREMRFYRDIQPFVTLPSPICYYAGRDPAPDAYQSLIIIEDLKRDGVEFCHALRPQRFEQVARRLDAMARYHVELWDSDAFRPGGRFEWVEKNLVSDASVEYIDYYMAPQRWRHFIESPRGAAVSVRLHDGERLRDGLRSLARFHENHPRTLLDGDTHLGNLYIQPDGSPGFFDMMVNQAPWFHEVTYHIICALDIADRAAWERPLLMHYLDCLRAHGLENPPGFEEAFECYRRDIVWGLFVFLINETNFQTEAINTAYAARFGDAAIAHGTMQLLR
ncbi:MAG: hypothetical protein AB7Q97_00645 [Gammaproteobacteria bacterium]